MLVATWIVNLVSLYLLAGVIVAVLYVWRGVTLVDPAARATTWPFRLIIIPGCAALWPFVLMQWIRAEPPPRDDAPSHHPGEPTP